MKLNSRVLPGIISCLYLLLIGVPGLSQDYKPFINSNSSWVVRYDHYLNSTPYDWVKKFYFSGDTLINGINYSKMYEIELEAVNNDYKEPFYTKNQPSILSALIREDIDAKKVYAIYVSNPYSPNCTASIEVLLYDFSKQLNDSIEQCNVQFDRIRIDLIDDDDKFPGYKAFYYKQFNQRLKQHTEGIGLPQGPLGFNGDCEDCSFKLIKFCSSPGDNYPRILLMRL